MNPTQTFLGDPTAWPFAHCRLFDIQGLWGGRAIYIWGNGHSLTRIVSPTKREQRHVLTLNPAQLTQVWETFIANDFLALEIAPRPGIPDEAHPDITLVNPFGQAHSFGKWAGQIVEPFDRIYAQLLALAQQAAAQPAEFEGPFDWNFEPQPV